MKKIIVFLMAFILFGCSSPQSTQAETATEPEVNVLESSENYTFNQQLEFEIMRTSLTDEIAPTNKNKSYQYLKPADDYHIFIDVVVKTKNLSDQEYELADIYSGEIEFHNQKHDIQMAIENLNYTQISTTDTLKPQEERYIHLYCEVEKENNTETAVLTLRVMNQKDYQYTFSLEQVQESSQMKSVGDMIVCSQSELTILNYQQSERIEPSQKGIFYSYYPTDSEDQIFVVLSLTLKNTSSQDIDPSSYVYCEYEIDGETISSQILLESEDHKSISKKGSILSGQTRTIYLAMPILKSQSKEQGTTTLFVEGNTFVIDNQNYTTL